MLCTVRSSAVRLKKIMPRYSSSLVDVCDAGHDMHTAYPRCEIVHANMKNNIIKVIDKIST
ncbi:hypothetical protein CAAN1_05S04588 [[Candida] anglica]|uniref:Uncharacterized protein n=1 Tax=[Candida] anglica TaxID=148631 RepID=A0ABP0ED24_9ASCO